MAIIVTIKIDYDKLADEYAVHRNIHPDVLKSITQEVNLDKKSKVLEIGCGTGNYIIKLHELFKCQSWGVDPSKNMLNQLRRRNNDIMVFNERGEKMSFNSSMFDFVFSVDVIHHTQFVKEFYEEVFRVLAPHGKICTVTDSEWIIRSREPVSKYFPETIIPELNRYPSIESMKKIMSSIGYENITEQVVSYEYYLDDISSYEQKVFSALHLITNDEFRDGLDRMKQDLKKGPIKRISRYLLLWGVKP
jgi:ubiquinone/menaquinone biosynthesis C-methylase UbiE